MTKQNEADLKDYSLLKETIDDFLRDHPYMLKRNVLEKLYCNLLRARDTFFEESESYSDLYQELEDACMSIGLEGEPEDYPELDEPYIDEDYNDNPKEYMTVFLQSIEKDITSLSALLDNCNKQFVQLPEVIKGSHWGRNQINDFTYNGEMLSELKSFLNHLKGYMKEEGYL